MKSVSAGSVDCEAYIHLCARIDLDSLDTLPIRDVPYALYFCVVIQKNFRPEVMANFIIILKMDDGRCMKLKRHLRGSECEVLNGNDNLLLRLRINL